MRIVLLVIPAMLMLCPTASAKGGEDYLLLSEIKMKYLEQYAYRLDLSLAQWVTVLDLHQENKKRYQELRTREIAPWLKIGIDRNAKTFAAILKEFENRDKKFKYFRRRMAAFDNDLFLSIESILTEEQLERMPGVRKHRRRQFAYLFWGDGTREGWDRGVLDLSDIVHAMTLTRAEAEVIDPILNEYERRLTPLCDQATDICIDWYTIQFRELVKRGFGESKLSENAIWEQVEQDLWTMPKGRRLVRLAVQIDTLTHKTAQATKQAFVDERREEWIDAYVKAAYPELSGIRIYRRRIAESLDSITHLSDDEQAFLTAIVEEYERRMYDLLGKNMKATDNTWTPNKPETEEELSERWKKILEVWKARPYEIHTIRDWFRNQLEQGLGPAAFAEWDGTHTRLSTRPDWRPRHASGQHVRLLSDSPLCLSERDVDQVLDRFDLDDETRAAVSKLMVTYRSECRTVRTEQLEAMNSRDGPLEAQYIRRTLQRDSLLLEVLKQTIESDEVADMLDWLMPMRLRQQYARNLHGGGKIDPVTFLFDAELTTEHFGVLAPKIDAYNDEVNPLYRQRYDLAVHYMQENEEEYFKYFSNDKIDALNRRISVINDRVMRAMTAALPELLGTGLLDTFHRTSHRYLYEDRGQLHQVFQRPTLWEAMTSDQRWQIEDLHADYISRYTEITDAMVALVIDADAWTYGDLGEPSSVPVRDHTDIAEYAPLYFKRDDLNAETNVRIRTILTPQQVRMIGGLPDLD